MRRVLIALVALPGQYLMSVQRTIAAGLTATARLHVDVTQWISLRQKH
jgi:hypothetical protein